jgi:hypothetical protein
MIILFTKSDKIGSRIIRWFTGEGVSHCAVMMSSEVVLHSTGSGTHLISHARFIQNYNVVYTVWHPAELDHGAALATIGTGYDFFAIIWLGLKLFLRKMLFRPIERKNNWEQRRVFMCTELVSTLVFGEEDSTITPEALYLKLLATGGNSSGDK